MPRTGFNVLFILLFLMYIPVDGAKYEIRVTTAKDYQAGTDARVFIDMIGMNDQATGPIELGNNNGKDDFETGSTDTFYRYAKYIKKPIKAIKIKRFNGALYARWKLDKVVITVDGSAPYTFNFNKWIKEYEWVTSYEEDECRSGLSKCEQLCFNTNTGYRCGCRKGYQFDSMYTCKDVDECSSGRHSCDLGISSCINTQGSYICHCATGYKNTSKNTCEDVDECATSGHKCDLKTSTCVNKPGSYSCHCREGYGKTGADNNCHANQCSGYETLGMENGKISNQSITASSHYTQYPPWSARLRAGRDKSWYAQPHDPSPWIQVDLGKPTWLKGVATQGKRFTMFVKTYKLAYSSDKVTWLTYRGNEKTDKVFNGNTDPYTVVTNILKKSVYTRYVRVYPLTWNDALVLKLELYGC